MQACPPPPLSLPRPPRAIFVTPPAADVAVGPGRLSRPRGEEQPEQSAEEQLLHQHRASQREQHPSQRDQCCRYSLHYAPPVTVAVALSGLIRLELLASRFRCCCLRDHRLLDRRAGAEDRRGLRIALTPNLHLVATFTMAKSSSRSRFAMRMQPCE